MTGETISMILDVMIILLLAGTAFMAARLSVHLKNFRQGRKNMEKLLADLTTQVDRAESAILGMRENARSSGRDLQQVINDAKSISDELQIIIGSADGLAERLAKTAERAPKNVSFFTPYSGRGDAAKPTPRPAAEKSSAGFAIRDPEFGENDDIGEDIADEESVDDSSGASAFGSRAERELFDAMSQRGKKSGAVR